MFRSLYSIRARSIACPRNSTEPAVLAAFVLCFCSNLIFGYSAAHWSRSFRHALASSGYIKSVGVLQVLGGGLLLCDVTVALELLTFGPIIVNCCN